ncbi:non-ribosomal peptide synthetase, partial [Antrihabitans cavernicola]
MTGAAPSLTDLLEHAADVSPELLAFAVDDVSATFAQLHGRVVQLRPILQMQGLDGDAAISSAVTMLAPTIAQGSPAEVADRIQRILIDVRSRAGDAAGTEDVRTLVSLFEEQVARTPDAVAIVCDGIALTYRQFDARANRLARHLIGLGVGAESLVGVGMRRSVDLLVGLYAVIKAGGAYVPLDPDHPMDRTAYILDVAQPVCVLVTERDGFELPAGTATVAVDVVDAGINSDATITDQERLRGLTPANCAYVIFTSGSTGRPKGVALTHGAVVNQLLWIQQEYGLTAADAMLQKTPVTFDVSVWELFWPFQIGARLVIAEPDRHADADYLAQTIEAESITVATFVPTMLTAFVSEPGIRIAESLDSVLAIGEALPASTAEQLRSLSSARLHNLYGPTEAAVSATFHEAVPNDTASVPIGLPVANTRAFVLDSRLRPVPPGVAGELYLSGVQLARGYVTRPELTSDRFVANPFGEPGERMYRTGDLVLWSGKSGAGPLGELEYLGRTDFQVKVRGLRIELGEIEAALTEHDAVARSVVIVREDKPGQQQLVAYVVPSNGSIDTAELAAHAGRTLPAYMVPAAVLVLDRLPLNSSGKLDRNALPQPVYEARTFTAPTNPVEEIVAESFSAVLGIDRAGVDDDFFELGGNSLMATQLVARLGVALGSRVTVRELFEAPTVGALAARVETDVTHVRTVPLVPQVRPERIPLSLAQQRMWFLNQFDIESAVNNLPVVLRLSGEIDVDALQAAVGDVIERHESLRTVFPVDDGDAYQVIVPAAHVIPDLTPIEVDESEIATRVHDIVSAGFDVTADVPLRAQLLASGPVREIQGPGTRLHAQFVLVFVVHHISGDGWSMGPLTRDVMAAYSARCSGAAPSWTPLPVQYADYSLWQRAVLGSEDDPESIVSQQITYWQTALADLPDELNLPSDRPRPAVQSFAGGNVEFQIAADLHRSLSDLARDQGATLFMVMHSALAVFLARMSGTDDIAIGTPVAGRGERALDDMIGMFVNTLVLRSHIDGGALFADVVRQTRDANLEAFGHADVPFERLVDALNPERSTARHPLFQVALSFANLAPSSLTLPELTVDGVDAEVTSAKFDLALTLTENVDVGGIAAELAYARDLFDQSTVESFADRFTRLLRSIVTGAGTPIGDLALLDEVEYRTLTHVHGSAASTRTLLVDCFARGALRNPDKTAVRYQDRSITYRELDEASSRLARLLIQRGVGPETFVALAFPRSYQMVLAVWAVAKTGGAYVPIDPTLPDARIRYMLSDSAAIIGITTSEFVEALPTDTDWLLLDDPATIDAAAVQDNSPVPDSERLLPLRPRHAAYMIYTSGSTGMPKGVLLTHSGLGPLVDIATDLYHLTAAARFLHICSPSFDPSILEWCATFYAGATLVIVPASIIGGPDLADLMKSERVTHTVMTPAVLSTMAPDGMSDLKLISAGGDVTTPELVAKWAPGRRYINGYGPTETTIISTFARLAPGDTVTIGSPVRGTSALVLDTRMRPVPPGVAGELYLAGDALARGYRDRPDLTAASFVADPYGEPGERLYRTGDVVRWNAHGELVFAGRSDFQVKVRGFRIELGEIDAVIGAHPDVDFVLTMGRESAAGVTMLVSYVRPAAGAAIDVEQLTDFAAEALASHMVPAAIVVLDEVPLTPVGKLDRKALPLPVFDVAVFRAPTNSVEEVVAEVFADVLGIEQVGLDDDFFALGGNSLVATRVVARIGAALGVRLPVRALFDAPTVEALAARSEMRTGATVLPTLTARPRPDRIPLSMAQQRMWFLNRFDTESAVNNVPAAIRLSGALDLAALRLALGDVVARHETLRTRYPEHDGVASQIVLPARQQLPELTPIQVAESDLADVVAETISLGFDVAVEVPWRITLFQLGAAEFVLVSVVHHIAADGWSMGPLTRDVMLAYAARAAGGAPEWAPLAVQYADYALWQREMLGSEADPDSLLSQQLKFWSENLADIPDQLDLPADRQRPAVASGRGATYSFDIAAETYSRLDAVARDRDATLFMVAHAAFAVLISRLTGSADVVIGTPVAGRGDADLDDLIGMFVNTLALRTRQDPSASFADVLAAARETDLQAFAHAEVPFERLVEVIDPERSQGRHPIFQSVLSFENLPPISLELSGLTASGVDLAIDTAKFDLLLTLREDGAAEFTYATDLFDRATVSGFADRFLLILEAIVADADVPIGDIELLDDAERRRLVPRRGAPAQTPRVLPDLLASAAENGAATALISGSAEVTYRELDSRSNQLAHSLIRRGVGPEDLIAVAVPRSVEAVVAVWAVTKAGAAFVPVDPSYPADRITHMITDSGAVLGLSVAAVRETLPDNVEWLGIDDLEETTEAITDAMRVRTLRTEHPAYVIYTSGSTGTPKGVIVTHAGMANFAAEQRHRYGIRASSRVLGVSSPSFDASMLELLMVVDAAATLVISPAEVFAGDALEQVIVRGRVTHAFITPSVLASMDPAHMIGTLEVLVAGGEAVSADVVARWAPGRLLFNGYGPTETTIMAAISDPLVADEPVTMGGPIRGMRAVVLDERLHPVPVGVVGELFLAGIQLARGYHARRGLTAERFVADPYGVAGERLYRTGDLVRWTADATLDYRGRSDFQVKVRGLRIELGEIEAVLAEHEAIDFAVVTADRSALAGFVVAAQGRTVDLAAVTTFLAERLPAHMVPTSITVLDAVPLTPVGKLDRKALVALPIERETTFSAPRTEDERAIAAVFADVLGVERVGIHDSFFGLGGDSILSIQLVSRASAAGVRFTPKDVFESKTVARLAQVAVRETAAPTLEEMSGAGVGAVRLTPIVRWLVGRSGAHDRFSQAVLLTLPSDADHDAVRLLIQALMDRHDMLRSALYAVNDDEWHWEVGEVGSVDAADMLAEVHLDAAPGTAAFEQAVLSEHARAAERLVPATGKLVQLVHLTSDRNDAGRVLLVIHHLAVDGVSWRILIPELVTGWSQLVAGQQISLPDVGTSMRRWAHELRNVATDRIGERDLWRQIVDAPDALLGTRVLDPTVDLESTADRVRLTLSTELTSRLTTTVPAAFRGGVNDGLLAGLALALAQWRRRRECTQRDAFVFVEGHGREEQIAPGADLSNTVGWFTTMFPVRLDALALGASIGDVVKHAKESLLALPDKGIGYGLLRYLDTDSHLGGFADPQISFNYLGRAGSVDAGEGAWLPAPETIAFGGGNDEDLALSAVIGINAIVGGAADGERLAAEFLFAPGILDRSAVQELADLWADALDSIGRYAVDVVDAGLTPSDVAAQGIRQTDVDHIATRYPTVTDIWPLSPLQYGLYFHAELSGGDLDVYTAQTSLHFSGEVDESRLRRSADLLVRRHPNLGAAFLHAADGSPYQVISTDVDVPWNALDFHDLRPDDARAELDRVLAADRRAPFDMAAPPLIRFTYVQMPADASVLIVNNHHILLDGWSMPLVQRELMTLYATANSDVDLPPSRPYVDYLSWVQSQNSAFSRQAWRTVLQDAEPTLIARAATGDSRFPVDLSVELDEESTRRLTERLGALDITMSTATQLAWAIMLATVTGRDHVVFGETVSGRPALLAGVESMVGLFINTVPVAAHVDPSATLAQALAALQADKSQVLDHHYLGLSDIVGESDTTGALFDTLTVFESYPVDPVGIGVEVDRAGLRVTGIDGVDATHYPLMLQSQLDSRLQLRIRYQPDSVDPGTAALFARGLRTILATIADDSTVLTREIDLLDAAERQTVLVEHNRTAHSVDGTQTLVELFDEQAAATPDSTAVRYGVEVLTYSEFASRVRRLARYLIGSGVGPESRVAVAIPRSTELVVAIHAVLAAGGAYVPIDPEHPADRIAHVLATARPVCVIGVGDVQVPADIDVVDLSALDVSSYDDAALTDVDRLGALRSDNTAYVLFTSGSTGRPKGVVVSHAAVVNQIRWITARFDMNADDVVLVKTPATFDVSVWELFGALSVGASIVVVTPDGHRDPAYLAEVIAAHGVTLTSFVPSMLSVFAESAEQHAVSSLRALAVAGEALTSDVVAAFRSISGAAVHNLYGPTEVTVHSTATRVAEELGAAVSIGSPVWNTQAYVLDSRLRPVPIGVAGELYLAGRQLAYGYESRGALTADRFVANPFGDAGDRLYRTGDVVTRRTSGELDYLGRSDFQVKLRGQRIELGEIEAALDRLPAIRRSVVVVRSDDRVGDQLVAYVVVDGDFDGEVDTARVRTDLSSTLPTYMVPAAVVVLERLPLNSAGKLDRKALPDPVIEQRRFRPPATAVEEVVAAVYADVLGVDQAGRDDDFFTLGGNSLTATQVAARLGNALDASISVRTLFQAPTVRELAAAVEPQKGEGARAPLEPMVRPELIPLSSAQRRMWFLNRFDTSSAASNIPFALRLSGTLNADALAAALADVVDRHETLRTTYPDVDGIGHQSIAERGSVTTQLQRVNVDPGESTDWITEFARRGFDVATDVPLRAALLRISPTEHVLALVVHHIAADGASIAPLATDLVTAYSARLRGYAPDWTPLSVQYADYTLWQREWLGAETDPDSIAAQQLDYWSDTLCGLPERVELPIDRPRPPTATSAGGLVEFTVDADLRGALEAVAQEHDATLFMVLHTALAVLTARLANTDDVAIGTPVAGRGDAALDTLIGMFVNTVVLRTEIDGAATFSDLLATVRERDIAAFGNSDVPFERLVEVLDPVRSPAHHPLFQVSLVFQNLAQALLDVAGLSFDTVRLDGAIARFDLELTISPLDGAGLAAGFTYAADLFDEQTVERFARQYVMLLRALVADAQTPVGDANLLDASERNRVVTEWNATEHPVGRLTLPELLSAPSDPDAVAITFEGMSLTYGDFSDRVNRLARRLIADGVGPESLVAVAMRRSLDLVVG